MAWRPRLNHKINFRANNKVGGLFNNSNFIEWHSFVLFRWDDTPLFCSAGMKFSFSKCATSIVGVYPNFITGLLSKNFGRLHNDNFMKKLPFLLRLLNYHYFDILTTKNFGDASILDCMLWVLIAWELGSFCISTSYGKANNRSNLYGPYSHLVLRSR